MNPRWLIVGAGHCGLQLARAMRAAGIPLAAVAAHSRESARRARRTLEGVPVVQSHERTPPADAILLAVPDSVLPSCAATLARHTPQNARIALHTSGLLPAAVLAPLAQAGRAVASFHPLTSFPTAAGPPVPLAGVTVSVEGAPRGVRAARELAVSLGMRPHLLRPEAKPLYHAAAAVAGNLTHFLVVVALDALVAAGFSRREAARGLRPLVAAAVDAALTARDLEHMTGPLVRGDGATVAAHLAVLPPEIAAVYRAAGRVALSRIERRNSLARDRYRTVETALTVPSTCASVPFDESS